MTDKFQNKYRIQSARLQTWNYGLVASYFVTVCTANRRPFFGKIVGGKIILSEIGKIVEREWIKTPSPASRYEFGIGCILRDAEPFSRDYYY